MQRYATIAILITLLSLIGGASRLTAQESTATTVTTKTTTARPIDEGPVHFGVAAGLNVGATTPLPKPKAIDKIYAWSPHMNIAVKGWLTYDLPDTKGWLLGTGLEVERKGMYASVHATNLNVSIAEGQSGGFTGNTSSQFINYYLTLPLVAGYELPSKAFRMQMGFFLGYLMQSSFNVTLDGAGTLNGTRLTEMGLGELQDFDFSDQMSGFDMGFRVGFDYFFHERIGATAQLNVSFEPTMKRSFKMMPFPLYNMYAFVGFSYRI